MDNNTPPNDPNDPILNQETPPIDEISEDTELYEPEPESLGKSKNTMYIIGGVLVAGVSFLLYSIFYTPQTPKNLNPAFDATGSAKVSGEALPEIDTGTDPSLQLPSPPQITLQAPPPPIESPVYTPPPIVAPPPVTLGLPSGSVTGATGSPTSARGTITDEAPPPPPPIPAIAAIKSSRGGGGDDASKKRMKANMLLMDGGGPGSTTPKLQPSPGTRDPNGQFAQSAAVTVTEKVTATILNNLNMTIAQGKIVNAVLENAINTDLPGTLRAIVSRDTYAEAGRDVLIPKGSRLIGTYNTEIKNGQNRVMIVWSRLIRPDGVDIQIGSPGIDGLGRAGIKGDVDNKFSEIFTAAILTSTITIGAAVGADAVLPQQTNQNSTTTTTPEGNQITSATPAQQAAANAVQNLGSTGKNMVDRIANINPTITVDQGTLISVFVNKDLTFPSNAIGGELFIR